MEFQNEHKMKETACFPEGKPLIVQVSEKQGQAVVRG